MATSSSKHVLSPQDYLATPLSQDDIDRRRADLQAYVAPRERLSLWLMGGEMVSIVLFLVASAVAAHFSPKDPTWLTVGVLPIAGLLVPGVCLTWALTMVRPLVAEMRALEPEQEAQMAWLLEHTVSAAALRKASELAPRPFILGELLALQAAYQAQKKTSVEVKPS